MRSVDVWRVRVCILCVSDSETLTVCSVGHLMHHNLTKKIGVTVQT